MRAFRIQVINSAHTTVGSTVCACVYWCTIHSCARVWPYTHVIHKTVRSERCCSDIACPEKVTIYDPSKWTSGLTGTKKIAFPCSSLWRVQLKLEGPLDYCCSYMSSELVKIGIKHYVMPVIHSFATAAAMIHIWCAYDFRVENIYNLLNASHRWYQLLRLAITLFCILQRFSWIVAPSV